MTETASAYAKINLSLDIVSKMNDGYHNLETIMQSISLCDEITVKCAAGAGVSVSTNMKYLPSDERNIAVKAARAFFKHTGIKGYRLAISIEKNIPICAGMGGGSSDGACILRMLDKLFGTNLGMEQLERIGATFGSDVPFCIAGGTALAEGRGDILTELAPIPRCYVVICKPSFICSTPELFKRVRCDKIKARPDTGGIIAALGNADLRGMAQRMYNVFEDVLPRGAREVEDIKYTMHDYGALGAAMTGSGPSVFGVFDDASDAKNACDYLRKNYKECFLAETMEQHNSYMN